MGWLNVMTPPISLSRTVTVTAQEVTSGGTAGGAGAGGAAVAHESRAMLAPTGLLIRATTSTAIIKTAAIGIARFQTLSPSPEN